MRRLLLHPPPLQFATLSRECTDERIAAPNGAAVGIVRVAAIHRFSPDVCRIVRVASGGREGGRSRIIPRSIKLARFLVNFANSRFRATSQMSLTLRVHLFAIWVCWQLWTITILLTIDIFRQVFSPEIYIYIYN